MNQRQIDSPLGTLHLMASDDGLTSLYLRPPSVFLESQSTKASGKILDQTAEELAQYFQGQRRSFDVLVAPVGTPFQMSVWRSLRDIPYGETRSYLAIAKTLNRDKATQRSATTRAWPSQRVE